MSSMDIHQMQVSYDPRADRLLWNVRSRAGELFGIWLTRRMTSRFLPTFERMVAELAVPQLRTGQVSALPEARELMAEVARQQPLAGADFKSPFDTQVQSRPLGPEPLLPDAIDLTPNAAADSRALTVRVREQGGRSLELKLAADVATGFLRLVDSAVKASDWFSGSPGANRSAAPAGVPGQQTRPS